MDMSLRQAAGTGVRKQPPAFPNVTSVAKITSRKANARSRNVAVKSIAAPMEVKGEQKRNEGHSALLQGLGEVGDVPTVHVPWLLRLAHIR